MLTQAEDEFRFVNSIRRLGQMCRKRQWLFALFAPILIYHVGCDTSACNDRQSQTDVIAYGDAYQKNCKYDDLRWLAENFLSQGLSTAEVERVMGAGIAPPTGALDAARVYPTIDGKLTAGLLYVHYKNGFVESWEWASE